MEPSEEYIKEFHKLYKKEHGKELTLKEAAEGARSLLGLAELAYDYAKKEHFRNQKLKKHPKGFHLDDGEFYSCRICKESISGKQTWWDKDGIKCLHCQKALERKLIPRSICKNDKSYYAIWEFDYHFNIKSPTVRKFIRQGKLKSRIIPNKDTGKPHFEILLIKDNEGNLPNKPKSYLVQDENNMIHVEYKPVKLPDFMVPAKKKERLKITTSGKKYGKKNSKSK